jgi:hypothetical protein
MTYGKLEINRPALTATWSKAQMEAAVVRIHQRFQGLFISIIESADWANYRLVDHPLEAGRPSWPDPGEYCDLVLQRREGEAVAAVEVKTRHIKVRDGRSTWMIADDVLDHMGPKLARLQNIAHQSDALWIVAIGLYRVPFQASAINFNTPFDLVLVWGRDIGRDSPMGRARFGSLGDFDRAVCDFKEPSRFFEVKGLPRSTPSAAPPPQSVTHDLEALISKAPLHENCKLALLCILDWPDKLLSLRTYMRERATEDATEYSLQHWAIKMIEEGVIKGYRKGKRSHRLTIDEAALKAHLKEVSGE